MAHIGVLSPGVPGHLNPISCLGRELQAYGHRLTAFQFPYYAEAVASSGLDYEPIGEQTFPKARMQEHYARLGRMRGLEALRYTVDFFRLKSEMLFAEAPSAISRKGIDLLWVDQAEPAGASIAEHLGLPFVTMSNALALNQEDSVPPVFTAWPYSTKRSAELRNRLAYKFQSRLVRPWLDSLNWQREAWHLPKYRTFDDSISALAQLSQQPSCFDFPRRRLPPQFHYTGPWHARHWRPTVPFPYEKLDGRPLIYASMGTLQNRIAEVFREIAGACVGIDAQLVISLGGGSNREGLGPLAGNPLVVGYAPQLDLLSRAALTVTHAGLNTVLESLSFGVPMVAIPVGNDQPGVAARVKYLGAGETLPLKRLTAERLGALIKKVLSESQYRHKAHELALNIQNAQGIRKAVEVIRRILDKEPSTVALQG